MQHNYAFGVEVAAKTAGARRAHIYKAISSGDLRSLKFGKRRLIRPEALQDWLRRLEDETAVADVRPADSSL